MDLDRMRSDVQGEPPRREPVFDLPWLLTVLIAVLAAITAARGFLAPATDDLVMALFAFIPDRYVLEAGQPAYPGGWGAMAWTFVTHAFLHDGWAHFGFNAAMLAAIGRAVLARIGTARFALFLLFVTVAGAVGQLVVDFGSGVPMIGASGAATGLLGGLMRFVFRPPWAPALTIRESLGHPRVQGFIGAIVVMNVVLAFVGSAPFGGSGGGIAWAVHLGGFLAGFLGFSWFDRPSDPRLDNFRA
jgi:membrane associated rhomboid family serine protease